MRASSTLVTVLLTWSTTLCAQTDTTAETLIQRFFHYPPRPGKINIEIDALAFSNSSHAPAAFSNAFIFPAFIDEELKQNANSSLNATKNKFGAELKGNAAVLYRSKSHKYAYGLHYGMRSIYAGTYPGDAFRLVFDGNIPFENREADLSNTRLQFLSWQSLGFEFRRYFSNLELGLRISAIHGISSSRLKLHHGGLFTANGGEYLELNYAGNLFSSSTFSNRLSAKPSPGAGLGFSLKTKSGKFPLLIEVDDLGIIQWNNDSKFYESDSTFRFRGILIPDLFSINDSTLMLGDSLQKVLDRIEKQDIRNQFTPAIVSFRTGYQISSKSLLQLSVSHRFISSYLPLIRLGWSQSFGKTSGITLWLGYGGYGRLNSALEVTLLSTPKHRLLIRSFMNEGFISPRKLSGNGAGISYSLSL